MKSSSLHDEDIEPGFQIAPMVDVVFVLLLFFMACAAFRAHERELSTVLTGPPTFPDTTQEAILVDIAADGSVSVNNAPFGVAADHQLPKITQWFREVRESFGEHDTVIIRAAPTITHERLMEVLSATEASGWRQVILV
jgi:biopolymer transport protein ExbD